MEERDARGERWEPPAGGARREPGSERPLSEHLAGESGELEDEEPGSYLAEAGKRGSALLAWSAVNLVLAVAVGLSGPEASASPEWRPLVSLLAALLPASIALSTITILWLLANPYARESRPRAAVALGVSLLAGVVWLVFAWALPLWRS